MKQRPTTAKVPKTIDQRELQQLHDLDSRQHQLIGSNLSHFTILNELGKGSYGVVYKVKSNQDGNVYVLKKINLTHLKPKHQAEALKEAQLLRKLKHPNVITYYMSFIEQDNLCIVMEYAEGGDLQKLLKDYKEKRKYMSEETIWEMSRELSLALQHLHENNIIHRDIKTLNVFLTRDKHIKLGDLGVSKIFNSETAMQGTRVGTPLYLAPELVQHQPYDYKVDIWALGCVVFYMGALEPPFQGENLIALGYSIVNRAPKALPPQYSTRLTQFIWKLLEKIPALRPTIQEVITVYFYKNEEIFPSMNQQVQRIQRPQTTNPRSFGIQSQDTEKMKKTKKPLQQDQISNGSDTIYMGELNDLKQFDQEQQQQQSVQQQQLEKERQDRIEKEREKFEKEKLERERERERIEKDKQEKIEREKAEKEKIERQKQEKEKEKEKERQKAIQYDKRTEEIYFPQRMLKIQDNQVELFIQDVDDKKFQEERKCSFSGEQGPKFKLDLKSQKHQNPLKGNIQIRPLSAQARTSFAHLQCKPKLLPVQYNQSVKEVKKFTIFDLKPNISETAPTEIQKIGQNNIINNVISIVNRDIDNQPNKTKENVRIKSAFILQYSSKRQPQQSESNQIIKHYTLKDLVES